MDNEFEKYNTLFANAWTQAISDYDIREILITVHQETWNRLKQNRNNYCNRIKNIIQEIDDIEFYGTTKLRVVEVNDETWRRMDIERIHAYEKKCDEEWKQYKKENKLSRPYSTIDEDKKRVTQDIEDTKKKLAEVEATQAKKYVAPSQRKADPPKNKIEMELISKIGSLQNELKNIGDRIVKENNEWEFYARRRYEEEKFLRINREYYKM